MAANASPPVAARDRSRAETQPPLQAAGGAVEPGDLTAAAMPVKPAESKSRNRDRNRNMSKKSAGADSKKKKTKSKEDAPRCVGYYLDALDKKMLWAEAKIIGCDVAKQKLRVHFIGWGRAHDIWTDTVSIAAHGRYAHKTKASNEMSWDGDMRLFEEMLGPIDESTPCHDLDLSTGVAPPPPPTPSQRRAAKAKAKASSSNGSMAPSSAAPAEAVEMPKKRPYKRKVPAAGSTPRARAPTPRAKPTVATTDHVSSRKRPKKSPAEPTTAPKKRRASSTALPEVSSVEALGTGEPSGTDGAPDPLETLEERRRLLAKELELSMEFLDRCAGIFQRQLAELTSS